MPIPVVCIPGMMCDARLFAPQFAALVQYPMLLAPITRHRSVQQLAAAILDYAPSQFALCGLSMGGIVAMEIVNQAADRVAKLCLMDTNPLAETASVRARRVPQIARVAEGKLFEVMRDELKPHYLADSAHRQDLVDLCMDMAMQLGAMAFVNQSIALRDRPDQCDSLARYLGDTLILHGESDRLCPAQRHQLLHRLLPNSTYVVIQEAGHLPTLEQPQATNAALRHWLQS